MTNLKIQHSITLKPKTDQSILNYSKFEKSLTKFPSWFLITFYYKNQTQKTKIIHLDNPIKKIKKYQLNGNSFFKGLQQEFLIKNCKTIEIFICKN